MPVRLSVKNVFVAVNHFCLRVHLLLKVRLLRKKIRNYVRARDATSEPSMRYITSMFRTSIFIYKKGILTGGIMQFLLVQRLGDAMSQHIFRYSSIKKVEAVEKWYLRLNDKGNSTNNIPTWFSL